VTSSFRQLALHFVAVAMALGCSDPAAPGEPPVPMRDASPLQTERLEYPFVYAGGTYRGTVVATFNNTGSAPVYLDSCSGRAPVFFVAWASSGSAPADIEGPVSVCVGSPPFEVPAGGFRTDTLAFLLHERDPNFQYTSQPRNAGRSGLYRLFYRAYARVVGSGELAMPAGALPQAAGLSNAFRIKFTR
jgi:hypothetical protein